MLCNKKAAVQDFVRERQVEVSEVRQVQIAAPVLNFPVVTLICYLDPEDICESAKAT